ncbi:MAG: gamma carbonic anhydrase family protein [Rhodospirillales bacterium]|nr:gamma carbonic anhydrase family protein [Rhodospirillales bacterium]
MNYEHLGKAPRVDPSARVAPNATLCGEVTIGANTAIGFGAVLTAESGPIVVGANCVIMDTAVIRGIRDYPVTIGDNVLVGPRAYLTGCTVEDNAFLATGCSVFNGAHIGERAEVCINGVVHIRTVLAADATVPIGWIAVGNPAAILPPKDHHRIWAEQKPLDFPRTVFGIDRPPEGESIMPDVMPRYAHFLGKHRDDRAMD